MEAACRIDKDDVRALCGSGLDRIERYGRRVGTHLLLYYIDVCPFSPNAYLIYCSCAESVRGAEHDLAALGGELARKFTNRSCLPYSVNSHYQNHIGLCGIQIEFFCSAFHQAGDFLAEHLGQLFLGHVFILRHPFFEGIDDLEGSIHTHVRFDQGLLDCVEGVVVDS